MSKQKKSVPFSTRLTEDMDAALEELADVKMLNKHDIVRNAVSDYLLKYRKLIDRNIEYKSKENTTYPYYELVTVQSTNSNEDGIWISGVAPMDDDHEFYEELVKIETRLPKKKDKMKVQELLKDIETASEEEKEKLKKSIEDLLSKEFVEEYTLKFTEQGLEVKDDPKLQEFIYEWIKKVNLQPTTIIEKL